MDKNKIYITKEGFDKLEKELKYLKEVKRSDVAAKIKEARDMGDILMNLPYDNALEEQGMVEARISEIEETLKNAEIIKSEKKDMVTVGSSIVVENSGNKIKFKLVSSMEADPLVGAISAESPVGKALIGRKIGDIVEINTPVITAKYKIVSIE